MSDPIVSAANAYARKIVRRRRNEAVRLLDRLALKSAGHRFAADQAITWIERFSEQLLEDFEDR